MHPSGRFQLFGIDFTSQIEVDRHGDFMGFCVHSADGIGHRFLVERNEAEFSDGKLALFQTKYQSNAGIRTLRCDGFDVRKSQGALCPRNRPDSPVIAVHRLIAQTQEAQDQILAIRLGE
jgi:hypothetical protein